MIVLALAYLLAQEPTPAAAGDAAPAAPPRAAGPTDDYGFVAWCRGALTGHMELYQQVRPAVVQIRRDKAERELAGKTEAEAKRIRAQLDNEAKRDDELDVEQHKAGVEYLDLYRRALAAAEAAGAKRARGVEMTGQGYRIWSAARASDDKTRMYSYLMWELPGRCETAAKSLEEKSSLLGAAFKQSQADATAAPETRPAKSPSAPDATPDAVQPTASPGSTPSEPALRPSAPAPGA